MNELDRARRLAMLPLRRQTDRGRRRFRRGVYLLPSMFTLGNMFCGYACVVHAMRGEYERAALFVGMAMLLDVVDGWIARFTGTSTPFGLQFDSLADVISFGVAPAVLTFAWGLEPLRRLGWAVSFVYVTATAMRLARFNIQSGTGDKRYFAGLPSPAAAAVPAATVFAYPPGLHEFHEAISALPIMLVPAFLMVSTIRFRSVKAIDLQSRRPYVVLFVLALIIATIAVEPRVMLLILIYSYLVSPLVGLALARIRRRPDGSDVRPGAADREPGVRDAASRRQP